MADGFLGRWSQRKQAARTGRPVQEPEHTGAPTHPVSGKPLAPAKLVDPGAAAGNDVPDPATAEPALELPAPTLQDVDALRADSDFTPFVARAVAPEVRNAAMKKLFADPHFNVMDGLDTYIDDYSLPDPLPTAMLRKMASAKFMQLFDDEPTAEDKQLADEGTAPAADTDQNPPAQDTPQQTPTPATIDPTASVDPSDISDPSPDQASSDLTEPRT